ncbi:uncharacterized protein [Gossypium hirsutum]|uniref:CCHC-type domain-containing protein n=1 Tax=Gossypium hirsutum TaxID=3635 RepID=A0A1U8M9E0_GOSHI|nr:uncharacterized protein LOC107934304 [Gossypium hirsutum]
MVGKVGKLDFNTDSRARGRFARMVVNVSLDKLLVSQVLINGPLQRIEYEYLPTVCFSCGCYGHMKELCSSKVIIPGADFEGKSSGKGDQTIISAPVGKESTDANDAYGPWMLVERRSRCNSRDARKISAENLRNLAGSISLIEKSGQDSSMGHRKSVGHKLIVGAKEPNGKGKSGHGFVSAGVFQVQRVKGAILCKPMENVQPNSLGDMGEGQATEVGGGFADTGVRIIGGKFNGRQRGKKLNRTIRDRGNIFKNSSTQVPLHESMRNLVESLQDAPDDGRKESGNLLKPRVCGRKTDEVIDKLGFQYSHRVEAVEFSGGIWISWKNTVNLEVIRNHPQFILVRICSSVSSQYVFIAFVYGSPNWRKRRLLWEQLKTTIPSA